MTPRKAKPKTVPIHDAIARTIRRQREQRSWTQADLAERMRAEGFTSWARTTVTESEGGGRKRQVTIAELLGLAHVFGVGVEELLWDVESQGDDRVALEVTPDRFLRCRTDLVEMLVAPDRMLDTLGHVIEPAFERTIENVFAGYIARVRSLADELRSDVGWFEEQAMDHLRRSFVPDPSKEEK